MKTTINTAIIFMALLCNFSPAKSQDAFGTLSFEGGFPSGDLQKTYRLLWGIGMGYEHPLGDALAIGGNVGYDFLFGKEVTDDATGFIWEYDNTYMIPLQGFGKYCFQDQQEGVYLQMNAGLHFYKAMQVTYDVWGIPQFSSNVESGFSFAPAIGFVEFNIDMSLRYQVVSTSPAIHYIAVKAAYMLFTSN